MPIAYLYQLYLAVTISASFR